MRIGNQQHCNIYVKSSQIKSKSIPKILVFVAVSDAKKIVHGTQGTGVNVTGNNKVKIAPIAASIGK
jgi:hypothetical protein